MAGIRAVIKYPDGGEQDITDLVRLLYDGVVGSLDWGSGWWSGEDAAAVAWIGLTFGWVRHEDMVGFVLRLQQFQAFRHELDASVPPLPQPPPTGG